MVEKMTMEELEGIIMGCDKNKSPRLDGLSYEFYQGTFTIIKVLKLADNVPKALQGV